MKLITSYAIRLSFTFFISFPINSYSQLDPSYKLRDNVRYEGIVSVNNSSRDLELKSFTINSTLDYVTENDILYIHFFNPGYSNIYIRISEIIPIKNYQMNPVKNSWGSAWNRFDSWPVNQVIIPSEVNINNLGGIGSKNKDLILANTIVPLHISKNNEASEVSYYKVRFLSRETFSIFQYELKRVSDSMIIKSEKLRKEYKAGTPITISLDSKDYIDGQYELWVYGKIKNENSGPERRYVFYHKGR